MAVLLDIKMIGLSSDYILISTEYITPYPPQPLKIKNKRSVNQVNYERLNSNNSERIKSMKNDKL